MTDDTMKAGFLYMNHDITKESDAQEKTLFGLPELSELFVRTRGYYDTP